MNSIYHYFKKIDWILLVSAVLLVCLGLISIYGSSLGLESFLNLKKQATFFFIGFSLMILISFLDFRVLKDNSYLILFLYFISIVTLIGLFFVPGARGVQRWYSIGSISIDPREFTKIILIIILAKYFSARHVEMYRLRHIFLSGIYVFIPSLLIFFQPDLGYASILIL